MELVRQFNSEMASIYESKPPISKAKMASITRFAVKALKYYKHIVHSVEKFLHKCHPDYKLPGLYVLDSIIRQSRHQFGVEKDLFGPRFLKNITLLFQNIYQCPQEEKPKVVRVLNLWQRNGIYTPEIISPLVDMASTSSKVLAASIKKQNQKKTAAMQAAAHFQEEDHSFEHDDGGGCDYDDDDPMPVQQQQEPTSAEKKGGREKVQMSQGDEIQVLKAQLEQQRKQQELLQQQLQMQIMATKQQALQLQLQQQQMQNKFTEQMQQNTLENAMKGVLPTPDLNSATNSATLPGGQNLLSQITELTQQLEKDKATLATLSSNENSSSTLPLPSSTDNHSQFLENFQQLIQSAKGIILKDPRQHQGVTEDGKPGLGEGTPKFNQSLLDTFEYEDDGVIGDEQRIQDQKNRLVEEQKSRLEEEQKEHLRVKRGDRDLHGTEEPPSKKSSREVNERSGDHPGEGASGIYVCHDDDAMQIDKDSDDEFNDDDLYRPEQSSLDDNDIWPPMAPVNRSEDKNVSQEDQERKKKHAAEAEKRTRESREAEEHWKKEKSVMPPPRSNRLTVASTTVWVGRLPRGTHPDTLYEIFSEYGDVKNIDMIEMRGCAFVTMGSRFNADRALRNVRNRRIDGMDVKVAWGQPKNLQEFGKHWDENFGCSFIPWGTFKPFHLRFFTDGAIMDKDTLPPGFESPREEDERHKSDPSEEPATGNMPLDIAQFQRGIPPGLIAPQGLPPHGFPPRIPGLPPPEMIPPPPPPIMPPGFRGQIPPIPLPGMLGLRPPLPPPGLPPPGGLLRGPLPPGVVPPAPAGVIPWPPGARGIPGMPPFIPLDPASRIPHSNGRESVQPSLLPQPPPLPHVPNKSRRGSFPRAESPPQGLMSKNMSMDRGLVLHASQPDGSKPPPVPPLMSRAFVEEGERSVPSNQPPPQKVQSRNLSWGAPAQENQLPPGKLLPNNMKNNNHNDIICRVEDRPVGSHHSFMHEKPNPSCGEFGTEGKHNTDVSEIGKRDADEVSSLGRSLSPEKFKDERDRKPRGDFRDTERKEKKDRDNRRDDRSDRRDRDREREREDRDDRRERDRDRDRKGRDDRDRGDRYRDRSRDERGRDNVREVTREKGKDEFGRDESTRFWRDEICRAPDRNRRDEDFSKDQERSCRKMKDTQISDQFTDPMKLDEVSSSSDKKTINLESDGDSARDGKSNSQSSTRKSEFQAFQSKTSQLANSKSDVHGSKKRTSETKSSPVSSDGYTTIPAITSKSSGKKGPKYIPFSFFPLPSDDNDEDGIDESGDGKSSVSNSKCSNGKVEPSIKKISENKIVDKCLDDDGVSHSRESQEQILKSSPSSSKAPTSTSEALDTSLDTSAEVGDSILAEPACTSIIEDGCTSNMDVGSTESEPQECNAMAIDSSDPSPCTNNNISSNEMSPTRTAEKAEQSTDVVTSSGDHHICSEQSETLRNSPIAEPSSGVVSSSADPPLSDESVSEVRAESSGDVVVTSSNDQIMDLRGQMDCLENDREQLAMPTSTTSRANAASSSQNSEVASSGIESTSESSTCQSSVEINENDSRGSTIDDSTVNVISPEYNSLVSTSESVLQEGAASNLNTDSEYEKCSKMDDEPETSCTSNNVVDEGGGEEGTLLEPGEGEEVVV